MEYYVQKNTTLNNDQLDFLKENKGKMSVGAIAKILGVGYNKCHNNLKLLGLYKPRKTQVVEMKGYFSIKEFAKHYKY